MSISIPGRVVVFDYGEVISRSPSAEDADALLALTGVEGERFWEAYWRLRPDLDQGRIHPDEYWALLAEEFDADWSPSRVQQLWAADFRSWISVEPGTVDLLAELHDGGTRIALLSNAGYDFGDPFRHSPMGAWFEDVFVSAELDDLKPAASIYRLVAERLDIPLEAMVFVDNKPENVAGAEALGVTGHVFTTPDALRAFLGSLAGPASVPAPLSADEILRPTPGAWRPMNDQRVGPYWSLDLPGLSEENARRLLAWAEAEEVAQGGTVVDPRSFYSTHMTRAAVVGLLGALRSASRSDKLSSEEAKTAWGFADQLEDWLSGARGGSEPAFSASIAELTTQPDYSFAADGAGSRATLVAVEPHATPRWTAAFAAADPGIRALSALLPTPDPTGLCVVERGTAFLGDVRDPERLAVVSTRGPVVASEEVESHGVLLLLTPWSITALDASGIRWTTPRIAIDGLRFDAVAEGSIHGVADPHDEPRDFAIELATGRVSGGAPFS